MVNKTYKKYLRMIPFSQKNEQQIGDLGSEIACSRIKFDPFKGFRIFELRLPYQLTDHGRTGLKIAVFVNRDRVPTPFAVCSRCDTFEKPGF